MGLIFGKNFWFFFFGVKGYEFIARPSPNLQWRRNYSEIFWVGKCLPPWLVMDRVFEIGVLRPGRLINENLKSWTRFAFIFCPFFNDFFKNLIWSILKIGSKIDKKWRKLLIKLILKSIFLPKSETQLLKCLTGF